MLFLEHKKLSMRTIMKLADLLWSTVHVAGWSKILLHVSFLWYNCENKNVMKKRVVIAWIKTYKQGRDDVKVKINLQILIPTSLPL